MERDPTLAVVELVRPQRPLQPPRRPAERPRADWGERLRSLRRHDPTEGALLWPQPLLPVRRLAASLRPRGRRPSLETGRESPDDSIERNEKSSWT